MRDQTVCTFPSRRVHTIVAVHTGLHTRMRRVYVAPPLRWLSKLDCSTTKSVPLRKNISSESSRRDLPNADVLGTDTTYSCGDIDHGISAEGGVILHRRIRARVGGYSDLLPGRPCIGYMASMACVGFGLFML